MAITYVGKAAPVNANTATTATVTYSSTGGNTLVAIIQHQSGAITSVTDSAGNTWVKGGDTQDDGATSQRRVALWYVLNAAAVTSVSVAGAQFQRVFLYQFSGVVAVRAVAKSTSTATSPPAAQVTAQTGDYVLGAIGYAETTAGTRLDTLNSGYTELDSYDAGTTTRMSSAGNLRGASGATGPSWTMSSGTTASITIGLSPTDVNVAPVAEAGDSVSADSGETVTVGGVDTDSDGTIVARAWSLVSGATGGVFGTPTAATTTWTAPIIAADSTVVLRKTVTDDKGAVGTDDVAVTVRRALLQRRVSGAYVGYALRQFSFSTAGVGPAAYAAAARTPSGTDTVIYVDPTSAAGSATGALATPYKTAAQLNALTLTAGTIVYFKAGTTLSDRVTIAQSGTSTLPITLTSYGTGAQPIINCAQAQNESLRISGAWVDVVNLKIANGSYSSVTVAGANVSLRGCTISDSCAGVQATAARLRVLGCAIANNNRMSVNTPTPTTDDSGAFGVALAQGADDAEVAYNEISGHLATSYDFGYDGAAVEIYGANRANVHHNLVHDNETFAELGYPNTTSNSFTYNAIYGSYSAAKALVTRGSSDSFGPVLNTTFSHNSVYFTGTSSAGIVAYANAGQNIITVQYNAIKVAGTWAFVDDSTTHTEDHNVFSGGVNRALGTASVSADPLFVSATDLHLQTGSPARSITAGAYS